MTSIPRSTTWPAQVHDIGGGTRIADALHTFQRDHARRVLGHGAIVLIISDGWDRGDPEQLGREMARLRRICHRLIWLNPLLGSTAYRAGNSRHGPPALPDCDDFLSAHSVDALDALGGLAPLSSLDGSAVRLAAPPAGSPHPAQQQEADQTRRKPAAII